MCTRESISALGDPFYIGESIISLCTRGPRSRKKSVCFVFKPVSKRFHSRVGRFHRSRVSQGIRMHVAWRIWVRFDMHLSDCSELVALVSISGFKPGFIPGFKEPVSRPVSKRFQGASVSRLVSTPQKIYAIYIYIYVYIHTHTYTY